MYGHSGADSDWEIVKIRLEKVRRSRNSGWKRNSGAELTSPSRDAIKKSVLVATGLIGTKQRVGGVT